MRFGTDRCVDTWFLNVADRVRRCRPRGAPIVREIQDSHSPAAGLDWLSFGRGVSTSVPR